MNLSDREASRKIFFDAWHKYTTNQALEPLESEIIRIILCHPEYQVILNDPASNQSKNFDDSNPFLHLGLHLGIREQVSIDRPAGVAEIYQQLCKKHRDPHVAEHKFMEYLAKVLWEAEQHGKMIETQDYLAGLKKLL